MSCTAKHQISMHNMYASETWTSFFLQSIFYFCLFLVRKTDRKISLRIGWGYISCKFAISHVKIFCTTPLKTKDLLFVPEFSSALRTRRKILGKTFCSDLSDERFSIRLIISVNGMNQNGRFLRKIWHRGFISRREIFFWISRAHVWKILHAFDYLKVNCVHVKYFIIFGALTASPCEKFIFDNSQIYGQSTLYFQLGECFFYSFKFRER